jgi:hypothetical protein
MAGTKAALSTTPVRSNQRGVSITPGMKYAMMVALIVAVAA